MPPYLRREDLRVAAEAVENKDSAFALRVVAGRKPSPDFKVKKAPLKSGVGQFRESELRLDRETLFTSWERQSPSCLCSNGI